MNKTKILLLLILFLVTTNIVTIVSIVKSNESTRKSDENTTLQTNQRAGFFSDQLGLNQIQRGQFSSLNRDFNREARLTTGKIESLRFQMIDEMAAENPDTAKLDIICTKIGDLHCQLKKSTVGYYLGLKNVCTGEQVVQLHELFKVMADPNGDISTFKPGMGMQKGRNGRRGKGMQMGKRNGDQQSY